MKGKTADEIETKSKFQTVVRRDCYLGFEQKNV